MKATRTMAVAAAGAIAAATAVISAGPASAATPRMFCVNSGDVCASANGASAVQMIAFSSGDFWLFNGLNHPGQIQLDGSSLCMQLDHNAGNIIIVAACNGASYQKWSPGFLNGNIVYRSQWDTTQCLTYNQNHSILDTVTCNGSWYQNFPYTN